MNLSLKLLSIIYYYFISFIGEFFPKFKRIIPLTIIIKPKPLSKDNTSSKNIIPIKAVVAVPAPAQILYALDKGIVLKAKTSIIKLAAKPIKSIIVGSKLVKPFDNLSNEVLDTSKTTASIKNVYPGIL